MGSNCPICFEDFENKVRASPDNCDHVFCLPCLEKWSKLGSYCPVDRKRYKRILNLDSEAVIQVKPHKRRKVRTVYDFTTKCEVCSKDTNDDVLLLCDCCDLAFHLYCLSPSLKEVPAGLWFCPTCTSVEEKLKKKNGITKEIEAELGGSIDKELLKNTKARKDNNDSKESSIVSEKSQNIQPVRCKNNSVLETCQNIISEFQDIDVKRNYRKNVCNSDNLDNSGTATSSELDKKNKTFDFQSIISCDSEHSKKFKTYSGQNIRRSTRIKNLKPPSLDQAYAFRRKLRSANVDKTCLKNSVSGDVDLLDRYLADSVYYGLMKPDAIQEDGDYLYKTKVQECDINNKSNQSEPCSSKNYLPSVNLYESVEENWNQKKSQDLSCLSQDSFENNVTERSFRNKSNSQGQQRVEESSQEKEHQRINKSMFSSDADDFVSCNAISDESPKGISNNLISEFLNKNVEEQMEAEVQFSVFDKIEGIGASQKIYSEFASTVDIPLCSNLQIQHCFYCKDKMFAKSVRHCKICKLKYFDKSADKEKAKCLKNSKKKPKL